MVFLKLHFGLFLAAPRAFSQILQFSTCMAASTSMATSIATSMTEEGDGEADEDDEAEFGEVGQGQVPPSHRSRPEAP